MKRKNKGILALAIAIFIILFSNIISSDSSNLLTTSKTCSQAWNQTCNVTTWDDSFKGSGGLNGTQLNGCNGTQYSAGDPDLGNYPHVTEIYINQTTFLPNSEINATCEFQQYTSSGSTAYLEYLWYWNTTNWVNIQNWTNTTVGTFNRSAIFELSSAVDTHIVRCIISWNLTAPSGGQIPNECANITYSYFYDNDDVNFTVTNRLTYNFWNITNHTIGTAIGSNNTYSRNSTNGNVTLLNVSANWSKQIDTAFIEHNGNGSFVNYTVCSPCSGTWTNYTLNLSNTTEFSRYNTTIRAIYVNDTYGLENSTSPELYFYLNPGIPPNITSVGLVRGINGLGPTAPINLYDHNIKVIANASDDVGLSEVKANITYPISHINVNGTMVQELINEVLCWTFTFNSSFPINETGSYTIGVIAVDIGGQEKVSGIDDGDESVTIDASNNYSLETINRPSNDLYMRGENVSFSVICWNDPECGNFNWIYNVTKINETFSESNAETIFNYTVKSNDPEGNYSIFVNASLNNNSGNDTFEFNVSKNLTVYISSNSATPGKGNHFTITSRIYNARDELYTNNIIANITCRDENYTERSMALTFTAGQATRICYAPDEYNRTFTVRINVSDNFNNTGESTLTLRTEVQTVTSSNFIPGGGGFAPSPKETIKNCSDGTLYNQCSSKRPYYCRNGTLIKNCSVCGCEPGYGCQPDGSCIITKEEDFNFTLDVTKIEIMQGEDYENKIGSLKNTGNTVLKLITFLNFSGDCCNISIPSTFELKEKEEKDVEIRLHVPLFANASSYLLKIGIGTNYFKKERTIEILVRKSPHYNSLTDLSTELANLEKEIQEYKRAGIDTRNFENLIQQSKSLLYDTNGSISSDQISTLKNSLSDITNNVNYIQNSLTALRTQRFIFQNAWLIGLFIIMSFTTMYMVPQVLIPLNKKEKELTELKTEEETLVMTRVETEKQYFMRKIDENTFTKIMIGKQDRILKVRAMIREKENERTEIIKSVSLVAMFSWFEKGVKNIPKRILKRKDKTNNDTNGKTE